MTDEKNEQSSRLERLEKELQEKNSLLLIYKEEISKMNERLSAVLNQLDDELQIANALQSLIVPTEIPKIPGFEFSTKFKASNGAGGDYYEILHNEDKYKFGILMSTSSGYSMSALFLSVLLKMTSKLAKKKGYSPIEFNENIQKEMRKHMSEKDSFSIAYLQIDRKKNLFTYCGCGDLGLLRWNSKKQEVENLSFDKGKIAKSSHLSFSQNEGKFLAEDRFILASEGFVTQKNSKGNAYDIDSLIRVLYDNHSLPIHELRNEYFVDLERFSKGQEKKQDWTLVLMDVKTNLIQLALK